MKNALSSALYEMDSNQLKAYRLYKRRYATAEISNACNVDNTTITRWIKKYNFAKLAKDEDVETVFINYAKESARNLEDIQKLIQNCIDNDEKDLAIRAIMTSQKILDSAFKPAELHQPDIVAFINTIAPVEITETKDIYDVGDIFEKIKGGGSGGSTTGEGDKRLGEATANNTPQQ